MSDSDSVSGGEGTSKSNNASRKKNTSVARDSDSDFDPPESDESTASNKQAESRQVSDMRRSSRSFFTPPSLEKKVTRKAKGSPFGDSSNESGDYDDNSKRNETDKKDSESRLASKRKSTRQMTNAEEEEGHSDGPASGDTKKEQNKTSENSNANGAEDDEAKPKGRPKRSRGGGGDDGAAVPRMQEAVVNLSHDDSPPRTDGTARKEARRRVSFVDTNEDHSPQAAEGNSHEKGEADEDKNLSSTRKKRGRGDALNSEVKESQEAEEDATPAKKKGSVLKKEEEPTRKSERVRTVRVALEDSHSSDDREDATVKYSRSALRSLKNRSRKKSTRSPAKVRNLSSSMNSHVAGGSKTRRGDDSSDDEIVAGHLFNRGGSLLTVLKQLVVSVSRNTTMLGDLAAEVHHLRDALKNQSKS